MGDPLATAYADYLRLRACSPNTVRRVECTLRLLGRILSPSGLEHADGNDIAQLLATAKAPATRAARHSDVRAFYRWALRRGLVAVDPTILIDGIRVPKNLPRPIDHPERITHAADPDTALMVALGLYAGLRRSEIARLSMDDVHGTFLVVRGGKGGKDRQVPPLPQTAHPVNDLHYDQLAVQQEPRHRRTQNPPRDPRRARRHGTCRDTSTADRRR